MAAPVESYVQIVTDASNTGDKHRSQSRVVGSNTVHSHDVPVISIKRLVGVYSWVNATFSVQATAQNATSTGFLWMAIPAGSYFAARLRRMDLVYSMTAKADMLSVPRIALTRFTYTGVPSGAALLTAKRSGITDLNAVTTVYTASSGWTVTVGNNAWCSLVPTLGNTGGVDARWNNGPVHTFLPASEDEYIDVQPGEGLVLYQLDNGTATDTRRFSISGTWDEYDIT